MFCVFWIFWNFSCTVSNVLVSTIVFFVRKFIELCLRYEKILSQCLHWKTHNFCPKLHKIFILTLKSVASNTFKRFSKHVSNIWTLFAIKNSRPARELFRSGLKRGPETGSSFSSAPNVTHWNNFDTQQLKVWTIHWKLHRKLLLPLARF